MLQREEEEEKIKTEALRGDVEMRSPTWEGCSWEPERCDGRR